MVHQVQWHEPDGGSPVPWLEFGNPDGIPLVAMPGLNDGLAPVSEPATVAAVVAPPAALLGYRILLLSFPQPLAPGASTRDLARDLVAFFTAEVGRPAVVSGHSMGGMVAQHLAADRPDLVAGLILSATTAAADATLIAGLQRWDERLRRRDWAGFYRDAIDVSYTAGERLRRRVLQRLSTPVPRDDLVQRHHRLSAAAMTHDARDRLAAIEAPALVLAGARDPLVLPARSRELADGLPDARFEEYPQMGHGFPEQSRRRFGASVVGFVRATTT